jgi:uncharacterized protein with von Willebrand factor type A (vWA) domain
MSQDFNAMLMSVGLAGQVVRFADFLKSRGFRIFQSSIHDALVALRWIDLSVRQDFMAVLRTSLITNDIEWSKFDGLFDEFWRSGFYKTETDGDDEPSVARQTKKDLLKIEIVNDDSGMRKAIETAIPENKEWLEGIAYSPVSSVVKKDIARFDNADIQVAQLALKKIAEPFKIQLARRSKRTVKQRGRLDFPRIMRNSLKTGGLTAGLFFKRKKKRLKRLVIIADVSGSMERYTRFVMPFLLGLRGAGLQAEVFVFSTSLTSITFLVKHLPVEKALARISEKVTNWSGGTRIGYSLRQFNQGKGGRRVSQKTVVVIMSDGWDLGGKEVLKREMEALNKKAHCLIWLNPLADDPAYEPLCRGMRTVLPYVDYFMPVSSLQGLKRVGRLLSEVMAR